MKYSVMLLQLGYYWFTGCGDLNELNVPRHDHKQQIYAQHVISQAGLHIHDLTAALSDYHTYSEQRLHALFPTLSPVNGRVSRHASQTNNVNFLSQLLWMCYVIKW